MSCELLLYGVERQQLCPRSAPRADLLCPRGDRLLERDLRPRTIPRYKPLLTGEVPRLAGPFRAGDDRFPFKTRQELLFRNAPSEERRDPQHPLRGGRIDAPGEVCIQIFRRAGGITGACADDPEAEPGVVFVIS